MPRPRSDGQPTRPVQRRTLTDGFVTRIRPEPGAGTTLYWDTDPRRLALAVEPSGRKSFKLIYNFNNRTRWYNLGDAQAVPLKEARKRATELLGQVARGVDVQAEKRAARQAGTFEQLHERYLAEYATKRNRSWKQGDALVKTFLLAKWGKLSVKEISRSDVRRVFNRISDDGAPMMANAVLAAASAVFGWAIKNEVASLLVNPCQGIERNPTQSRERVLSDKEVPIFWKAFDQTEMVASSALKMILLTGQRPGEVRHMRREHLEIGKHRFTDANGRQFECEGAWWSMPGKQEKSGWPGTKNGQSHRCWLTMAAVAILAELDALDASNGFIFAGQHGRPISDLPHLMQEICRQLGVTNRATPHDLRRTFSTILTSLGFTRDQLNRQTNHKEGGIASVYDRHSYATENYRIAEAVAAKIMSLVEGEAGAGKVIPLHA